MHAKLSLGIGVALLIGLMIVGPRACTQPGKTTSQLESMGYTNITITGFDFFACSGDDSYQTGFEATAPNGKRVTGVYCAGFLKAGTVRFY